MLVLRSLYNLKVYWWFQRSFVYTGIKMHRGLYYTNSEVKWCNRDSVSFPLSIPHLQPVNSPHSLKMAARAPDVTCRYNFNKRLCYASLWQQDKFSQKLTCKLYLVSHYLWLKIIDEKNVAQKRIETTTICFWKWEQISFHWDHFGGVCQKERRGKWVIVVPIFSGGFSTKKLIYYFFFWENNDADINTVPWKQKPET